MIGAQVTAILILLMAAVTLIGRHLARLLPYRLRPRSILYLSPALGLGLVVLVSSYVGRLVGFATVPYAIAALMAIGATVAWLCERRRSEAAVHFALVAAVSLVAGSAILMCVWRYGGFNAGNDAFTYLVHGNWLQTHAFGNVIAPNDIEPYSTQVALYQRAGLRMGASFLLGWVQAMAGLHWSYVAYPAVISAAASALSFAAVFAASLLVRIRPVHGYLLACIPGISLGSAVFALSMGFLPQVLGSAASLSFLALGGGLLLEVTRPEGSLSRSAHWGAGLVLGGLLAVVVIGYSEELPFVSVGAFLAAAIAFAGAPKSRLRLMKLLGVALIAAGALANIDIVRGVHAIIMQSRAVVGWPVDWSLLEHIGHALGVHGGSGDTVGWIGNSSILGIALVIGLSVLIFRTWRHPDRRQITIALPSLCFGALCVIAFLYFRYMVPSPFPLGKGQSWSQYKLTNWLYPVVTALIIATLARLIHRFRSDVTVRVFATALVGGVLWNYHAAASRTGTIINQLGTNRPIFASLLNIRTHVMQHLLPGEAVYLDVTGDAGKLRQLLTYVLYDADVTGNWSDDGYIFPRLPPEKLHPPIDRASFVIAAVARLPAELQDKLIWRNGTLGMLVRKDYNFVRISSMDGGYDRESDGNRWWVWVRDGIVFALDETGDAVRFGRRISFDYAIHAEAGLSLEIAGTDSRLELALPRPPTGTGHFEKTLPPSFGPIRRLKVSGDGEPARLGPNDARMAKFLIANMNVELIRPDVPGQ